MMADDKIPTEPDDDGEEVEEDVDVDPVDPDEDELDEDVLEEDGEFVPIDEDFVAASEDEEEDDDDDTSGPVRRSVPAGEEEEDDDDIVAPDDVEADLDTILKDRLVAADDDDENEDDEPEEKGEAADRLQPKRADEQLCPTCFLLVRLGAPVCPIGDDECPIFS